VPPRKPIFAGIGSSLLARPLLVRSSDRNRWTSCAAMAPGSALHIALRNDVIKSIALPE
jgi:hypothetical protein